MKVFRNIALLLLFSFSTNSFAGRKDLILLTKKFHAGRTFTSVSAAPYLNSQSSLANEQEEKEHEINWCEVGMAFVTGHVGFCARAINGDQSGQQAGKEVKTTVTLQPHITDDLAIYKDFYIESIKEADKILRSKPPIDAFNALPEEYGAFLIEMCGYVLTTSTVMDYKKRDVCKNFLRFTLKEIINPKILEKDPINFRSKTIDELTRTLIKHQHLEILTYNDEYIEALVSKFIKYANYKFK